MDAWLGNSDCGLAAWLDNLECKSQIDKQQINIVLDGGVFVSDVFEFFPLSKNGLRPIVLPADLTRAL